MDQMQQMHSNPIIPRLVQVYQSDDKLGPQIIHISHPSLHTQGSVTYQQAVTSQLESQLSVTTQHLEIPQEPQQELQQFNTNQLHITQIPDHISLQSVQDYANFNQQSINIQTSQLIQSQQETQSLQITQHMLLPPVFKQQMVINSLQYQQCFEQFTTTFKKPVPCITKADAEPPTVTASNNEQYKTEEINSTDEPNTEASNEVEKKPKRSRSSAPNPNAWACNVRKQKHQSGEAYVSRRGKFVPEKKVKNTKDCLKHCKYKCNQNINDDDRENLFKAFYSLNSNEKKHFLLNTTERNHKKLTARRHTANDKRKYTFKYFFLVRGVRYSVCKNFYLGTLAISQKPVYNVHLGKSDMNIPKPDGRGLAKTSVHPVPSEQKEIVRQHILSFKTVDSKPVVYLSSKKQYLPSNLSIKQMYLTYLNHCSISNLPPVKESMYRKIFKKEFNLHFVKVKIEQPLCAKCKGPVKKKCNV